MLRVVKVVLVGLAIISVAYVLISPDLDEMDCVVRGRQLGKTTTTLVRSSVDPLSAFSARLNFRPIPVFPALDKPLLLDLICSRLC